VADVAVIIINYRTPELTIRCVEALVGEKKQLPQLRVLVVDGGSADGSAEKLEEFVEQLGLDWVSFLPLSINGGFGWANNQAMLELARDENPPEFIHLLNPDAEVTAGAASALVDALLANPRCGAAGSQLIDVEGKPAASAFRFPSPGREFVAGAQSEKLASLLGIGSTVATDGSEVDWVTGASVMLRANALREAGLFDDGFFLYFEEVELMHRLRSRGWTVRHVAESQVIHIEGASTGIGAATAERAHPAYWYDSRRRYFALTGGRATVVAANLAVVAGKAAAKMKILVGRSANSTACRLKDLFGHGFLPTVADTSPSIPRWGDAPGSPPAWMTRK
jgi:N-acetylglucosaminyl-diphospho-decaprenol L-rhamnosyltransferase